MSHPRNNKHKLSICGLSDIKVATVILLYRGEETKTQESWGLAQNTQQLLEEVRSTPQSSGSKVSTLTAKLEAST